MWTRRPSFEEFVNGESETDHCGCSADPRHKRAFICHPGAVGRHLIAAWRGFRPFHFPLNLPREVNYGAATVERKVLRHAR